MKSPAAERDVLGIYEHTERRSPERAVPWFAEIERQAQTLFQHMKRCPALSEVDDIGVEYRDLIWGHYRSATRDGNARYERAA